ncbi:MAG: carboxypeptidase-like regulatory domain-containing protein [Planctomycetota bacterium]
MNRRRILPFLVVLGIVAAVLSFFAPDRGADDVLEAGRPTGRTNGVAAEEKSLAESDPIDGASATAEVARASDSGRSVADSSGLARCSVRVTDANGAPLELDLTVDIIILGGGAETLALRTDASGLARFARESAYRVDRVRVPRTPDTAPATESVFRTIAPGETHEVTVEVGPGYVLVGRVVDTVGAPVANARVLAWNSNQSLGPHVDEALADEEGRFLFEHLPEVFLLRGEAEGMACVQGLRGELSRDVDSDDLVVRMAPASGVSGVVVEPSGSPVAGAKVSVADGEQSHSSREMTTSPGVRRFTSGGGSCTTDADGAFALERLRPGPLTVRVEANTYPLLDAQVPGDGVPLRLVLDPGLLLSGRVLGADGAPAVGATVRIGSMRLPGRAEVLTDEDGVFHARGFVLPVNEFEPQPWIGVLHTGCAVEVLQPVAPDRDGNSRVDVNLLPEGTIAGRVVDADGGPIERAVVRAVGTTEMDPGYVDGERMTWEHVLGIDTVRTDAEGRFRFERLTRGRFTLSVSPPGDGRSVEVETVTGAVLEDIVVDEEALAKVVLFGVVRDAITGEPVPSFRVIPFVGEHGSHNDFEDESGAFELSGLPSGELMIDVQAEGYATRRLERRPFAVGRHRIDVELAPERTLLVRVVDSAGKPVGRADLVATGEEGDQLMLETGAGSRSSRVYAEGGTIALQGLPAERVTFTATNDLGEGTATVDLRSEREHEVTIELGGPPEPPRTVALEILAFVVDADESVADFAPFVAEGMTEVPESLRNLPGHATPTTDVELRFLLSDGTVAGTIAFVRHDEPFDDERVHYAPGWFEVRIGFGRVESVQRATVAAAMSTDVPAEDLTVEVVTDGATRTFALDLADVPEGASVLLPVALPRD